MTFDWDPAKSLANKQKHGVSFVQAMEIWQGVHLTVENIARTTDGEKRSATIGLIGGKEFTAIWTMRKKAIRLISVRRSRNGEKKIYWQKIV